MATHMPTPAVFEVDAVESEFGGNVSELHFYRVCPPGGTVCKYRSSFNIGQLPAHMIIFYILLNFLRFHA